MNQLKFNSCMRFWALPLWSVWIGLLYVLVESIACASETSSRISDEYIPPQELPDRPFVLELGDPFLDTGPISQGFRLPTGAVWQPSLLLFGTLRSAFQYCDSCTPNVDKSSQWANRLDLFGQLRLSGTERILVGLRPLDEDGQFTRYTFEPEEDEGFESEANGKINILYFEGDIGEIFPGLDNWDSRAFDIGFAVGRQPILKQDGMLINDTFDSVGITRNTIRLPSTSNVRLTGLFGWNEINRSGNRDDKDAQLYGVFSEIDFACCTMDVDLVYVDADEQTGSGFFGGISSVQRLRQINTTIRVNTSVATDDETLEVSDGTLVFGELSWTPHYSHDLVYVNAFWAIDQFTSAARDPAAGGPLGRTGILFEAVGLGGGFPSPLSNQTSDAAGGAMGYQMFIGGIRKQLIFEVGGRLNTKSEAGDENGGVAAGARYQQAFFQRFIVQLDGFYVTHQEDPLDDAFGGRLELRVQY